MKKIQGKKTGSSLLMVLLIFSILAIVGMAILPLTVSGLKTRVVEGRIKSNLYASESGLDQAYGIIGKLVEKTIEDGNKAVDIFMMELNPKLEKDKLAILVKEQEPKYKNSNAVPYVNPDGTVNEEAILWEQKKIFKEYYYRAVTGASIKRQVENNDGYKEIRASKPKMNVGEVAVRDKTGMLKVPVTSEFKDSSNIRKIVSTTFEVLTPEYKGVYYSQSTVLKIPRDVVWFNKAIATDEDMDVNGGAVTIIGDVYVKGIDKNTGESIKDNGGISVSGTQLTITGNVATNENLQTNTKNSNIIVNGNVYADNVTVKKDSSETVEKNHTKSTITLNPSPLGGTAIDGSVFTKNDLTLDGRKSTIAISGGYFGFNDGENSTEPDQSSSIKVNSDDLGKGSSLSIAKDVIIKGVAYINTVGSLGKYKTGEAIAIKGNYRAYSYPLLKTTISGGDGCNDGGPGGVFSIFSEANGENKMQQELSASFAYYDPLTLISTFKMKKDEKGNMVPYNYPLSLDDKSNYFQAYYDQYSNNHNLNLGKGITIGGRIDHVGTIVYTKNGIETMERSKLTNLDQESNILEKQKEFNTMVYEMGDRTTTYKDEKTTPAKTVSNQINFNQISTLSNENRNKNSTLRNEGAIGIEPFIVLNSDEKISYAIVGPKGKVPNGFTPISNMNGILITKGKVILCGEIDFKGTIIAEKSIKFIDNQPKRITYDSSLVEKLIGYNYKNTFKNVFLNQSTDVVSLQVDTKYGGNSDDKIDPLVTMGIIRDKLIRATQWKLVQ